MPDTKSDHDDQSYNKVIEDSRAEVEKYVQNNFKVNPENPNEFIEAEIGRNVVKLLFEGKFEENSEESHENIGKFPETEIKVEEVSSFEKANVSNSENLIKSNATKSQLDDKLKVVETQNNLEVNAKVKTDLTAKRVAVAKNVVSVCVKK